MKLFLKIVGGIFLVIVLLVGALMLSMRPVIPESVYTLNPQPVAQASDDGYLIFGATRNTGLEVAKLLVARGDKVTAFVRPSSDRSGLEPLGVEFAVGDAMDPATVRAAMEGKNFRAVLTTIGCLSCEPPPDFQGNANVADAAAATGNRRVLLITSIGVGDSEQAAPWMSRQVLAKTLPLKGQAEERLKTNQLQYTVIRPGGLVQENFTTGSGIISEDAGTFGFISRPELARLIVESLDDPGTIGKTFSAADPVLTSPMAKPPE